MTDCQSDGMVKLLAGRFVQALPTAAGDEILHPAQPRTVVAMKIGGHDVIHGYFLEIRINSASTPPHPPSAAP